jgi:hypothetical protein
LRGIDAKPSLMPLTASMLAAASSSGTKACLMTRRPRIVTGTMSTTTGSATCSSDSSIARCRAAPASRWLKVSR